MSALELDQRSVKVVVIGSQLVYGAVGNNTVARMIEAAGQRCVQVPTVQLSNLPHYPSVGGGVISDQWLGEFLDDLLAREVLAATEYVFVGYLGQASQAKIIAQWLDRARGQYPQLKLIVDPAMGDRDVGLYTQPEVAQAYAEQLVDQAWLLTPNAFELELLSGEAVLDEQDAANAALDLIERGCTHVLVTSAPTDVPSLIGTLLAVDSETFEQVDTALVETTAKGAGDCFAGLLIGQLLTGSTLLDAVQQAVADTATALSGKHPLFSPEH
ncbi:PfkB family carbohydrate kinase [Glutamicibacter uratoxydans]|uniref:PfkB family carbohydrate kinase n=1 Tax=Glutamicibacter uratoxydans TaxID=43667 RepID=UPI003D6FCA19